ncbi:MAG: HD domain-containing protein [Thermoanaerobaculum sp.]|nr:HD domain-containing protein [Thermoanaerobaculum sp.]MDW7966853.1 HD domain-containing phosphohydrolase [Thermoanaerobaculum sp.]
MLPPLDPVAVRRIKEVLYRFMEELQTTKAALYLLGNRGAFELVESFGFGRREAIHAEVSPDHPLHHWIRRHRTAPAVLAEAASETALGEMLRLSGSSTLMTVPLISGDNLVGFVDARDRAGRKAYGPEELKQAKRIAETLLDVLREVGLVSGLPAPAPEEVPPTPARAGKFPPALEKLVGFCGALAPSEGVAALGLTVADGPTVRCLLITSTPMESTEREALARHQLEVASQAGVALPPVERWSFAERPSLGREVRREEIRTLLLSRDGMAVVVSLLSPAGSAATNLLAAVQGVWELAQREQVLRRSVRNMARVLLEPGDLTFPHLRQHSQAVSELAQKMAQELGLGEDEEELVTLAGYLHDVGMRELDYQRVYRLERPQEADRRLYQRHPVVGARILEETSYPGLAEAVRHHHERWDGGGYPQRLAGTAIPLASRIVHLAEVFDVLTSPGSYKRPVTRDQALQTIEREAGKQFDPNLVPVLAKVVGA